MTNQIFSHNLHVNHGRHIGCCVKVVHKTYCSIYTLCLDSLQDLSCPYLSKATITRIENILSAKMAFFCIIDLAEKGIDRNIAASGVSLLQVILFKLILLTIVTASL